MSALGGDGLELLLLRGVREPDAQDESFVAHFDAIVLVNNLAASIRAFKTVLVSKESDMRHWCSPGKANPAAHSIRITKNLGRENLKVIKDGHEGLAT